MNHHGGGPAARGARSTGKIEHPGRVSFYAFDDAAESIDMLDALHPQTILAYGMNGRDVPIAHGAPLRLRVERQLGYKSLKFLDRILVTDSFADMGKLSEPRNGWAWYVGI